MVKYKILLETQVKTENLSLHLQGYFCQAVLAEKTRKNFLPEATFVALKECSLPPTFRYRSQAASLAGTIYENHKYSAQIINTNTVDEGAVQS